MNKEGRNLFKSGRRCSENIQAAKKPTSPAHNLSRARKLSLPEIGSKIGDKGSFEGYFTPMQHASKFNLFDSSKKTPKKKSYNLSPLTLPEIVTSGRDS